MRLRKWATALPSRTASAEIPNPRQVVDRYILIAKAAPEIRASLGSAVYDHCRLKPGLPAAAHIDLMCAAQMSPLWRLRVDNSLGRLSAAAGVDAMHA
jgi:hypothetical protein